MVGNNINFFDTSILSTCQRSHFAIVQQSQVRARNQATKIYRKCYFCSGTFNKNVHMNDKCKTLLVAKLRLKIATSCHIYIHK